MSAQRKEARVIIEDMHDVPGSFTEVDGKHVLYMLSEESGVTVCILAPGGIITRERLLVMREAIYETSWRLSKVRVGK